MKHDAPNPEDWVDLAWKAAHHQARFWGLDADSLVGAAMEGIIHAANKFDPEKASFVTYAWHTARFYAETEARRVRGQRKTTGGWTTLQLTSTESLPDEPEVPVVYEEAQPTDVSAERRELFLRAQVYMSSLPPRARDILERRYLCHPPETLEEISQHYGITRERVRQIEADSLDRLRKRLER